MSGAVRGALRRFAAALGHPPGSAGANASSSIGAVGTRAMRSFASKPAEFTFGDEDQARRYDDALASQVFRPWCEAMVEINEPVPGNKVLDLACGTGQLGVHLRRLGFSTIDGLDLSPEMLAVAEDLGIYRSLGEIDMTQPYLLKEASVEALTCCGIFGPSVIGPEHLAFLAPPMVSGARAVISINGKGYEERPFEDALEALFDDGLFREIYRGFNDYLPKEGIDALYVVLERF